MKKGAPAYLQKNFNDIMQQISELKNENNELKVNMQYAGLNGLNLLEMTQAERDRLQTHLSLGSIKTVQPDLTKTTTRVASER